MDDPGDQNTSLCALGTSNETSKRQPPSLLTLAAELRNKIYEYTFGDTARLDKYGDVVDSAYDRRFFSHSLALVNRQLHKETIGLYYELHVFHFDTYKAAIGWYDGMNEENRSRVTAFEFYATSADDRWYFEPEREVGPSVAWRLPYMGQVRAQWILWTMLGTRRGHGRDRRVKVSRSD